MLAIASVLTLIGLLIYTSICIENYALQTCSNLVLGMAVLYVASISETLQRSKQKKHSEITLYEKGINLPMPSKNSTNLARFLKPVSNADDNTSNDYLEEKQLLTFLQHVRRNPQAFINQSPCNSYAKCVSPLSKVPFKERQAAKDRAVTEEALMFIEMLNKYSYVDENEKLCDCEEFPIVNEDAAIALSEKSKALLPEYLKTTERSKAAFSEHSKSELSEHTNSYESFQDRNEKERSFCSTDNTEAGDGKTIIDFLEIKDEFLENENFFNNQEQKFENLGCGDFDPSLDFNVYGEVFVSCQSLDDKCLTGLNVGAINGRNVAGEDVKIENKTQVSKNKSIEVEAKESMEKDLKHKDFKGKNFMVKDFKGKDTDLNTLKDKDVKNVNYKVPKNKPTENKTVQGKILEDKNEEFFEVKSDEDHFADALHPNDKIYFIEDLKAIQDNRRGDVMSTIFETDAEYDSQTVYSYVTTNSLESLD